MSEKATRSFEEAWPELSRRLVAMLSRSYGVPAEDFAQETGLRLYRMWDGIDQERPLWPLVKTIALNLVRDHARRGAFREVPGELPEVAASNDVERSSIARLELRRVGKAMGHLSSAQRGALLGELGGSSTSTSTVAATKMMRMRARRRLVNVLEAASVAIAGVYYRMKAELEGSGQVVAASALAAVFVASGGLGIGGSQTAPPSPAILSLGPSLSLSSTATMPLSPARLGHQGPQGQSVSVGTSLTSEPGEDRRVRVPLGPAGEAEVEGSVQAEGIWIRVRDRNGPIPACMGGEPVGTLPLVGCEGSQRPLGGPTRPRLKG